MEPEKTLDRGNEQLSYRQEQKNFGGDDLMLGYPCGIMQCTHEEFPKVLYANEHMFRFLGITEESEDWRGFMQNNIFFMIPFEERRVFRKCLSAAENASEPITIEHSVHNREGGCTRLIGWIRLVKGRTGKSEYHFLYMKVPENRFSLQQNKEQAYLQALKGVYDLIFRIDSAENTVECLHKAENGGFPYMLNTRVVLSALFRQEVYSSVHEQDRERAVAFYKRIIDTSKEDPRSPLEITCRVVRAGVEREYHFVASRLDEASVLLCGREITKGAQVQDEPEIRGNKRRAAGSDRRPRVTIRTFGYFEVFVDGDPVIFRHEKSKEMLAILVDRRGGFVANPYLIACLWENETYGEKIQNRCRQIAYRMMETLKQYGIEDIIEKVSGRRRIIPEMVDCDYFNYMQGKQIKDQIFNGAYMLDYSWGEATLSTLTLSRTSYDEGFEPPRPAL